MGTGATKTETTRAATAVGGSRKDCPGKHSTTEREDGAGERKHTKRTEQDVGAYAEGKSGLGLGNAWWSFSCYLRKGCVKVTGNGAHRRKHHCH